MKTKTLKNWWFLAINGVISILFGILLLFFSSEFINTLVIWFGVVLLLSGLVILLIAIYNIRHDKKAGLLLFESIASIAIGLILIVFPEKSLSFFLILVGIWAIIIGVVQLVSLMNLKATGTNKSLLLVTALLIIAMGIILFFNPISFAVIVVKILGIVFFILGIFMIYFSVILKNLKQPEESKVQEDKS